MPDRQPPTSEPLRSSEADTEPDPPDSSPDRPSRVGRSDQSSRSGRPDRSRRAPRPAGDRIRIVDPNLRHGFTQLPRPVLKARGLSGTAKLVYALLLDYAWQDGSCFPGQARLASDLDATERTIRRALVELRDYQLIDWEQRGLKQTNLYYILDLASNPNLGLKPICAPGAATTQPVDPAFVQDTRSTGGSSPASAHAGLDLDRTNTSAQVQSRTSAPERTPAAHPERTPAADKEYTENRYVAGTGSVVTETENLVGGSSNIRRSTNQVDSGRAHAESTKQSPERSDESVSREDEANRQLIADYLEDIARELGDEAPLKSSVTRAARLLKRSGLEIDSFADKLLVARRLTKENSAKIREQRRPGRPKSAMRYWFAVLEDLLGLRPSSPAAKDSGTVGG